MPAHPANVHRLLYDEEQLVLVFPEGGKGTGKLYKDRYRLRRFGRGGFVEAAMRARAPIVPVAVIGAEEAQPIFAHLPLKRLTGLHLLPDHAASRTAPPCVLSPREVPHPLPGADPDRPVGRRAVAGHAGSSRPWRRTSAAASRRSCSTCSRPRRSAWLG